MVRVVMKSLEGQVALITGGTRGIGKAVAEKLARNGCDVAVSYVSSEKKADAFVEQLEEEGVRARAFNANQGDPLQVEGLVKAVVKHFGYLHILVVNAGIFAGGAIDDPTVDLEAINRQLDVNIKGVVALVRNALKFMGNGGRIILIGSALAERANRVGVSDYCGTKAALAGYTKGWARDLGAKNITVNLIQPGSINTDANPETADGAALKRSRIALGRFGQPEEVASAVAFLASKEASYITGAILNVDGGLNA